jgi:uncharacterized Zn finger protein
VSGLHFSWVECPECGASETYDIAADDAPAFIFECRECGYSWSMAGFAFALEEEP